jgi:hypothetical protein
MKKAVTKNKKERKMTDMQSKESEPTTLRGAAEEKVDTKLASKQKYVNASVPAMTDEELNALLAKEPMIERACVVCGLASTRHDWKHISQGPPVPTVRVACDVHTDVEFAEAVGKQDIQYEAKKREAQAYQKVESKTR